MRYSSVLCDPKCGAEPHVGCSCRSDVSSCPCLTSGWSRGINEKSLVELLGCLHIVPAELGAYKLEVFRVVQPEYETTVTVTCADFCLLPLAQSKKP